MQQIIVRVIEQRSDVYCSMKMTGALVTTIGYGVRCDRPSFFFFFFFGKQFH